MNGGASDLRQAENLILHFVCRIGHGMFQEVVNGIIEPIYENRVFLHGRQVPHAEGAFILSESAGFDVAGTAVHRNTEKTGERIEHPPPPHGYGLRGCAADGRACLSLSACWNTRQSIALMSSG